jgi:tRNA 5-methylaminomethyl-2-thiouridine biosynthesis bifunctional protein
MADGLELPATPLNGDGHLVAHVPDAEGTPIWLAGATFDRDSTDLAPTETDSEANRERLARLHPAAASALAPSFAHGQVNAWVGIRCASGDRRPLVGPLDADAGGLWACTALGSRGLSFAALCAELLAAQWHAEPLPLPATLAKALSTQRL